MRELKAYAAYSVYNKAATLEESLVYLKSEADKVIAELKDKCNMHDFFWDGCGFAKRGFKNSIAVSEAFEKLEAENKRLEKCCKEYDSRQRIDERIKFSAAKRLRHHKYKRCLAMAKLCHWKMGVFIYKEEKSNFYHRWFKRWLKIADQLKGAK